eukprot:4876942-Lingulodinium_polyedra.AAC.1
MPFNQQMGPTSNLPRALRNGCQTLGPHLCGRGTDANARRTATRRRNQRRLANSDILLTWTTFHCRQQSYVP